MTDVFIVSTGSYSDWEIYGIYSTREKAEAVRLRLIEVSNESVNDVTAHPLDEPSLSGRQRFCVESLSSSIAVAACYWVPDGPAASGAVKERVLVALAPGTRPPTCLHIVVDADSRDHARKVAADKFREYAALTGWPGKVKA